jgi:hypothetical protein
MKLIVRCLLIVLTILPIERNVAIAQQSTPSPSASPSPKPTPTPISLSEAAWQSESAITSLHDMANLSDPSISTVAKQLSPFSNEITSRLIENNQILAANPPLEILGTLQSNWLNSSQTLSEWDRDLGKSATDLANKLKQLDQLATVWESTRKSAETEHAPNEIVQRISSVLQTIQTTRRPITTQLQQILTLQDRVAEQNARIATALTAVRQAREQALSRLFVRDSQPLWIGETNQIGVPLIQKSVNSFQNQLETLSSYLSREKGRFYFHGFFIQFKPSC